MMLALPSAPPMDKSIGIVMESPTGNGSKNALVTYRSTWSV